MQEADVAVRRDQLFTSAAVLLHGCPKHQDMMDVQGTLTVTVLYVSVDSAKK